LYTVAIAPAPSLPEDLVARDLLPRPLGLDDLAQAAI
jgi:hypothetical protein